MAFFFSLALINRDSSVSLLNIRLDLRVVVFIFEAHSNSDGNSLNIDAEESAEIKLNVSSFYNLFLFLLTLLVSQKSKPAAVPSKLILERYKHIWTLRICSVIVFAIHLLGPLSCLVPPPLVNLLFRHTEVLRVLVPHYFYAFSCPHNILFELTSKYLDLSFSLSLSFANNLNWTLILFILFRRRFN